MVGWVGSGDEFSLLLSISLDTGSRRAKYLFGGNSLLERRDFRYRPGPRVITALSLDDIRGHLFLYKNIFFTFRFRLRGRGLREDHLRQLHPVRKKARREISTTISQPKLRQIPPLHPFCQCKALPYLWGDGGGDKRHHVSRNIKKYWKTKCLMAKILFYVIPGARPLAYTIPHGPIRGGGDP